MHNLNTLTTKSDTYLKKSENFTERFFFLWELTKHEHVKPDSCIGSKQDDHVTCGLGVGEASQGVTAGHRNRRKTCKKKTTTTITTKSGGTTAHFPFSFLWIEHIQSWFKVSYNSPLALKLTRNTLRVVIRNCMKPSNLYVWIITASFKSREWCWKVKWRQLSVFLV